MMARSRRPPPARFGRRAARGRRSLGASVLLVGCLALATAIALARPGESAEPAGPPAQPKSEASQALDGLALEPEDVTALLPPGAGASPVPSDEVFPPQTISIRFDHGRHLGLKVQPALGCASCHPGALTSGRAGDLLLPDPAQTCDRCHETSHRDLEQVRAGPREGARCPSCHLGEDAGKDGAVTRFVLPRPALRNSHQKHAARNVRCGQCHGQVGKLGLATRQQLPRMAGCFTCHAQSGAARGEARSHCTTCHVVAPGGRLQTTFATGRLLPPPWLQGADHGPEWSRSHRVPAAANSAMCANCHSEASCADCHDGRARSRELHPSDWISLHAQSSRLDSPRCSSCHQLQSFCGDCHRRVGVARDGPVDPRDTGRRFHPPAAQWSTSPRGPTHHAWEAMRNLNACVSCHSERDCATCHASRGIRGGQGVSPHPAGFQCGSAYARNPRPCLVCHRPNDRAIRSCP